MSAGISPETVPFIGSWSPATAEALAEKNVAKQASRRMRSSIAFN